MSLAGDVARLVAASAWLLLVGASAAAQQPAGGSGTLYYGTYDKKILVIDEATMAVRDSMRVSVGIPIGMVLSADRKKMYALDPSFEWVESFDLATRRATGKFTLSNDTLQVRMRGFNVDPQGRFAVLLVKTAQRKSDRFVIGRSSLLKYDLARKVVTDTIKWPEGEEREFAQILFSPDGNLMYFFTAEDVLVYDTGTLKQVDRWDLQRSIDDGMGQWNFGFPESLYEEPGYFTGLFRTTDPVNRRSLMGVARVDLVRRSVDFYSLGPSEPVGFALAPGRRRAYGLRQQVGNYQFWTFDLEGRRVGQRVEFEGRPRMGLTVSTNGRMLYVHTAGPTIDVYDAETLRLVRTVEYPADMTRVIVVPE
jgi:DNA-binding beta-propeller fold protein YncE